MGEGVVRGTGRGSDAAGQAGVGPQPLCQGPVVVTNTLHMRKHVSAPRARHGCAQPVLYRREQAARGRGPAMRAQSYWEEFQSKV